jgi:DICT domain-containing protein
VARAELDNFSFYQWALTAALVAKVAVRQLGDAHAGIAQNCNGEFTAGVRAMLHWCRVNELLTLERHASEAQVFAGFEKLSRVRPVLSRYRRLAESTRRLVIFGTHDETLPLDAQLVDVGEHPLSREWFLLIDAPHYKALLAARDLTGFGPSGPLAHRRFLGIALHDSDVVARAVDALSARSGR